DPLGPPPTRHGGLGKACARRVCATGHRRACCIHASDGARNKCAVGGAQLVSTERGARASGERLRTRRTEVDPSRRCGTMSAQSGVRKCSAKATGQNVVHQSRLPRTDRNLVQRERSLSIGPFFGSASVRGGRVQTRAV